MSNKKNDKDKEQCLSARQRLKKKKMLLQTRKVLL